MNSSRTVPEYSHNQFENSFTVGHGEKEKRNEFELKSNSRRRGSFFLAGGGGARVQFELALGIHGRRGSSSRKVREQFQQTARTVAECCTKSKGRATNSSSVRVHVRSGPFVFRRGVGSSSSLRARGRVASNCRGTQQVKQP